MTGSSAIHLFKWDRLERFKEKGGWPSVRNAGEVGDCPGKKAEPDDLQAPSKVPLPTVISMILNYGTSQIGSEIKTKSLQVRER